MKKRKSRKPRKPRYRWKDNIRYINGVKYVWMGSPPMGGGWQKAIIF